MLYDDSSSHLSVGDLDRLDYRDYSNNGNRSGSVRSKRSNNSIVSMSLSPLETEPEPLIIDEIDARLTQNMNYSNNSLDL
jgi:hypothetical protein